MFSMSKRLWLLFIFYFQKKYQLLIPILHFLNRNCMIIKVGLPFWKPLHMSSTYDFLAFQTNMWFIFPHTPPHSPQKERLELRSHRKQKRDMLAFNYFSPKSTHRYLLSTQSLPLDLHMMKWVTDTWTWSIVRVDRLENLIRMLLAKRQDLLSAS